MQVRNKDRQQTIVDARNTLFVLILNWQCRDRSQTCLYDGGQNNSGMLPVNIRKIRKYFRCGRGI